MGVGFWMSDMFHCLYVFFLPPFLNRLIEFGIIHMLELIIICSDVGVVKLSHPFFFTILVRNL